MAMLLQRRQRLLLLVALLASTTCLVEVHAWSLRSAPKTSSSPFVGRFHMGTATYSSNRRRERIRLWASTIDDNIHANSFGFDDDDDDDENEDEISEIVNISLQDGVEDEILFADDETEYREYLEMDAEEDEDKDDESQTIFPMLDHWRLCEDGSISGIVTNHDQYLDGASIQTSVLEWFTSSQADTKLDWRLLEDSIVTTVTGSQYWLKTPLILMLENWKVVACDEDTDVNDADDNPTYCLQGIVVAPSDQTRTETEIQTSPIVDAPTTPEEGTVVTTTSGTQYRLGTKFVYPLLQNWKRLEGGSLAGIVSRHPVIPDGELITTSPLEELDESHDGLVLVTTVSGSQYELGEAEPVKESVYNYNYEEEEEDYEINSDQAGLQQEDEEETATETTEHHVPKPPASIPMFMQNLMQQQGQQSTSHQCLENDDQVDNANDTLSPPWNRTVFDTP